jgi:hypothetical protein
MTQTQATAEPLRLPNETADLRERFSNEGYVPLSNLLTPATLASLKEEARRLEALAKRRDFLMECMENSPRHMTTVGGQVIDRESALIANLYSSPPLLGFLRAVTGLPLTSVPDPLERHVANYLHRPGDTHGAHFDDFPVALILFMETPERPEDGGLLEFVANTTDLADIDTPRARRAFHRAGDAYLLRSDTTAHRVTPLTRQSRRVVLNFAYATPDTCAMTTPSASMLYS